MPVEAQAPASTMPRPKRSDPSIVTEAATRLADRCVEWDPTSRRSLWIEALVAAASDWSDGYRLARNLDRHAMVMPDSDLVEILADAQSVLDDVHAEAEAAWVRIVGFSPDFAVGEQVTMRHGTGPVHSIDERRARYVVDVDRVGNGGVYANAEDVRAAA